jgi:hypothetical protein
MKVRTLLATILVLLLISGLSLSQESMSPEPNLEEPLLVEASPEPVQPEPRLQGSYAMETSDRPRSSRARSSNNEMVMKIFELKYFPVEDLEHLIENIFSIDGNKIHAERSSNRLILQATADQMTDIEALIKELDVSDSKLESSRALENLVYRVYMFEIPSGDQNLKPFSIILQTPTQVSSTLLLDVASKNKILVGDFLVGDERDSESYILIQGKAPSNESIIEMVKLIPDSQIKELKWDDDETFTSSIAAAHYSRLPAQIQKHIQKFLGEEIATIGYWFGSSSVPGEIEAPIGPWMLRLELETESDRELELRVEVEEPERNHDFERRLGRERSDEILSNTIRAKIGKPVIIGYNRQSYGTRKMGAMVILPEADMIQLNSSELTTP